MPAKIPATIITGFLGAGKTTMIRHLLENAGGRRIALIISEFGDLGIDGALLDTTASQTGAKPDIVELANGCICCSVADDFIPALETLLGREAAPDHIVIETSGLALPQPLVRAFNWPGISSKLTVDGVITVVDGKAVNDGQFASNPAAIDKQRASLQTLDRDTSISDLYKDQLACADMIVINKSDLLTKSQLSSIADDMGSDARAGAHIVSTALGAVPIDVLLGQASGAEADLETRHAGHRHDHHHDHDGFESFVVTRTEVPDAIAFAEQVADTIRAHGILRLKGFAAVSGKPMRLVLQAVGPRITTYFDRPLAPGDPRTTHLVVIGPSGLNRTAIEQALSA